MICDWNVFLLVLVGCIYLKQIFVLYIHALENTSHQNYNNVGGVGILPSLLGTTFGFLRVERWRDWCWFSKEGECEK